MNPRHAVLETACFSPQTVGSGGFIRVGIDFDSNLTAIAVKYFCSLLKFNIFTIIVFYLYKYIDTLNFYVYYNVKLGYMKEMTGGLYDRHYKSFATFTL